MEVRLNGRVYTCLEQLREQADEELFLFLEEWFDDRSYVLGHTSGSTGAPKEIQLSKADMRASARMTNAFLLSTGNRFYCCVFRFRILRER